MNFEEDIKGVIGKSGFWYGLLGCISKERNVFDIVELFSTAHQYLIDSKFPNIHLKYSLVRYIKTENHRKYYLTKFDNYLDLVKEFRDKEDKQVQKIIELIEKDKEKWLSFWDSDFFRKVLCDIDLIKKRWNLKSKEQGFEKKVVVIPVELTLSFLVGVISVESAKKQKQSLKNIASMILNPLPIDEFGKEILFIIVNKYDEVQNVVDKYNLKQTELWNYVKDLTLKSMNTLLQNITNKLKNVKFE